MKNLFLERLENRELQLHNPKQSQNFGRLILKCIIPSRDEQIYAHLDDAQQHQEIGNKELDNTALWLKLQLNGHPSHQSYFQHELAQYQHLSNLAEDVLLPHAILPFTDLHPLLKQHIQKACGLTRADFESCVMPQTLVIVDSQSLFDINPDVLTVSERIRRLILSIDALEKIHQLQYVHGDLKPEHFRIYQNQAYLIDFEQGGFLNERQNMENSATPRYMAPELFHAAQKSFESDIYALGIIWFEWLTQQKIKKNSYLDWAKWHCQQFNAQLFGELQPLQEILQNMLYKNKVNRCTNIYQIKQQLSYFV